MYLCLVQKFREFLLLCVEMVISSKETRTIMFGLLKSLDVRSTVTTKLIHKHTKNAFKSLLSFNATGFAELCLFLGLYLFNRLKGEANDLLHNKKKGSFQSLYFCYVNNKQIENNVYVVVCFFLFYFVHSN